ncbi:MAG TPA: hypothetical protein VFD92_17335 [Candidatus Binatia bacterium]|nr:hypothetical protein [Candidatus Binatia bacterium]
MNGVRGVSKGGARSLALGVACAVGLVAGPSREVPPAGGTTCRTLLATVRVSWQPSAAATAAGVVARVRYPASVDLPIDATGSARSRVENRTGAAGGLFDAVAKDTDADGRRDLVSVGLVTTGIPPGDFATIRFDCRTGAAPPAASEFSCEPDVAGSQASLPATCSVAIAPEAAGI